MVLLVQSAALVRNGNHLARVGDLVLGNAKSVLWDPEDRCGASSRRWPVCVGLDLLVILVELVHVVVLRNQSTQSVVVSVVPRLEELGNEVALLLHRGVASAGGHLACYLAQQLAGTVVSILGLAILDSSSIGNAGTSLDKLLLNCKRAWQPIQERVQSLLDAEVEQDGEDEEGSHENGGPNRLGDGEHADHADLSNVNTGKKLLESARVDQAAGIDLSIRHEQNVVSVGQVEQSKGQGRPEQNEGCDDRVRDTCMTLINWNRETMQDW